jgi:DNA-binding protein YbaB
VPRAVASHYSAGVDDTPVRALDDLLSRTRAALSRSARPDTAPVTATSEDGLVSAVVGSDGLVQSITMHPTILRRTPTEIAESITGAVNGAVDTLPTAPSRSTMIEELKAIQEESAVRMRAMSESFTTAITRLQER